MLLKTVIPVIFLTVIGHTNAVNLQDVCDAKTSCTNDNALCRNNLIGCSKGTCVCREGYRRTSSTACKRIRNYLEPCMESSDVCKDINMVCFGGICQCRTGYKYDNYIRKCIPDSKTHLGDTCQNVVDCYQTESDPNSMECVPEKGTLSPMFCRCKAGYIQPFFEFICRKPHVKERCNNIVGCAPSNKSPIDSSQLVEVCLAGVCDCPMAGILQRISVMGETYQVCLAKYFGTAIENGDVCQTSHQCRNKLCYACPGESQKYCVANDGYHIEADYVRSLVLSISGAVLASLF